jgi:hypothetical protein
MIVGRELTKLQKEFPQLHINKIDVLAHPKQAFKAGIKMIPTLRAGKETLSGFLLSSSQIREFVLRFQKQIGQD